MSLSWLRWRRTVDQCIEADRYQVSRWDIAAEWIVRVVGIAIFIIVAAWAAVALSGCEVGKGAGGSLPAVQTPDAPDPTDSTEPFAGIVWIAWACVAAGAAAFVASFFVPLIPRVASLAAIALGFALYFAVDLLAHWLGPLRWIIGVAAVLGAVPWIIAYVNWSLNRTGLKLASNGHREAGVAIQAAARGWNGERHKTKRIRLLARGAGA